jgi:hypothetical protein
MSTEEKLLLGLVAVGGAIYLYKNSGSNAAVSGMKNVHASGSEYEQTFESNWCVQIDSGSYYFYTKEDAENFLSDKSGGFRLLVKGKGRWVTKRQGFK